MLSQVKRQTILLQLNQGFLIEGLLKWELSSLSHKPTLITISFCRSCLVASILRPYCGLKPKKFLQSGFAKSLSTFFKESSSFRHVRFCETIWKHRLIVLRAYTVTLSIRWWKPQFQFMCSWKNSPWGSMTKIHMFAFPKPHSWLIITISVVKCTPLDLKCKFLGQYHFRGVWSFCWDIWLPDFTFWLLSFETSVNRGEFGQKIGPKIGKN